MEGGWGAFKFSRERKVIINSKVGGSEVKKTAGPTIARALYRGWCAYDLSSGQVSLRLGRVECSWLSVFFFFVFRGSSDWLGGGLGCAGGA